MQIKKGKKKKIWVVWKYTTTAETLTAHFRAQFFIFSKVYNKTVLIYKFYTSKKKLYKNTTKILKYMQIKKGIRKKSNRCR